MGRRLAEKQKTRVVVINARDKALWTRVRRLCLSSGAKLTWVVERAIEDFLEKHEPRRLRSK